MIVPGRALTSNDQLVTLGTLGDGNSLPVRASMVIPLKEAVISAA